MDFKEKFSVTLSDKLVINSKHVGTWVDQMKWNTDDGKSRECPDILAYCGYGQRLTFLECSKLNVVSALPEKKLFI